MNKENNSLKLSERAHFSSPIQAKRSVGHYSPDILNCLANLSSDEVFTSPELANRMLDLLPQELFCSRKTRFLDPCSKSGVFLREIAKRLLAGLEKQIPDLQHRIDHIMTKQVFGIACTDLTAEMSRRTLYCTKQANGEYSVTTVFRDVQGNLKYESCRHTWNAQGRCEHCGASQGEYLRADSRETYAYPFIHKSIKEIFKKDMQFDVIIGNPPYQLNDGGGTGSSAMPLYHYFVEKAKKLTPNYLLMIIPARWYAGGKGLDDFRNQMLSDKHISMLYDYPNSADCFPGVIIAGGICYFLWDKKHDGLCKVYNMSGGEIKSCISRDLSEFNVFIRDNEAIKIIRKTHEISRETFDKYVHSRNCFSLISSDKGHKTKQEGDYCLLSLDGKSFISKAEFTDKENIADKYKVIITKAMSGGNKPSSEGDYVVVSSLQTLSPKEVCTETYLVLNTFETQREAANMVSYVKTKFFRFMLLQSLTSINISKDKFQFVPLQDFSHPWTDEMLYKKYDLDKDEIAFIESMIRPME